MSSSFDPSLLDAPPSALKHWESLRAWECVKKQEQQRGEKWGRRMGFSSADMRVVKVSVSATVLPLTGGRRTGDLRPEV